MSDKEPKQNDILTDEQIKKILSNGKPAWIRLRPSGNDKPIGTSGNVSAMLPKQYGERVTQNDFLLELEPSGHAIFDERRYPNKLTVTKFDDNGEPLDFSIENIARISIAFQQIIKTKQKNHITGKPLKFVLTSQKPSKELKERFVHMKQKFVSKNMDIAFAECVDTQLSTGDVALYFFRDKGRFDWEVFGFNKGDFLIPVYDNFRRLQKLYRFYSIKTETGDDEERFMEINSSEVLIYRNEGNKRSRDWKLDTRTNHGYSRIPVVYKRGDVAWDKVQYTIEETEWAFSQFCESNAYFAFPILFVAGEVNALPKKGVQGKVLDTSDPAANANYISRTAGDMEPFKYQLENMINFIFMGSFSVNITPDVIKSSGDMPGSAIRIIMHPEIDKAIELSKEWDDFVDQMKDLFIESIGIEDKKGTQYKEIDFRIEIEIYIPENTTELVNNLNQSVTMKSLSKETAREKNPLAAPDENERAEIEDKEEKEFQKEIKTKTVDKEAGLSEENKKRQLLKQ